MPQELTTQMMEPLANKDEVRPFDKQTVYATGYKDLHKYGEKLELHPLLAKRFIDEGKATSEKPSEDAVKKGLADQAERRKQERLKLSKGEAQILDTSAALATDLKEGKDKK